jgi:S1-C subfamily serine protease
MLRFSWISAALLGFFVAAATTSAQDSDEMAEPGYAGMTLDADELGALRVVEVHPGGPADQCGFRSGDLLLAIDGQPLRGPHDLLRVLRSSSAGMQLAVIVDRRGRRLELELTLGELHDGESQAPMLGVQTIEVTPELREQHKLPMSRGAFVAAVTRGSPADKAGIPRYALIAKVNGHSVAAPNDLLRWVEQAGPGGNVELIYYEGGRLRKASLKLTNVGSTNGLAVPPRDRATTPPSTARRILDRHPLPTSDRQRIRMLEQRIEQLERRIAELEKSE